MRCKDQWTEGAGNETLMRFLKDVELNTHDLRI